MRFPTKSSKAAEGDMTPMIDMTFQLIAFFMVLINFSDAEQNERITLPLSSLAKPPDAPADTPLTLQLTREGTVLFAGDEVPLAGIKPFLLREKEVLTRTDRNPAEATVIIRADAATKTGVVQELIRSCQETGFEKFTLRAKQEEG
ncbi:MAG: biopolymer transporter ExbD [Planctomycetaceae bacterium]|nr:biopolymer transporter ExbD [Planctomycetaceae bacterium]